MQVTRIEIFGFKSFLEKLALPLAGGVTGIVGPNGCGKSNIVDALRWVLGETKASNLRGSVLEDVIFNGTETLRPLGLAEVSLTVRATGENIFADLLNRADEVIESLAPVEVVVQEIEAESAAEVSAEMAAGAADSAAEPRPQLTVIQGGKEDGEAFGAEESLESLAGESVDTPVSRDVEAADEFAGDTAEVADEPLEARSEDAETAVDSEAAESVAETVAVDASTPQEAAAAPKSSSDQSGWLSRYGWLRAATEVQITRRLYRSGEAEFFINRVPARLKDIKEFVRALGMGARAYTIVAQGEVGRIVTAKPEDRRMILEEAAGVVGFRDQIGAAERRLEETNQSLARLGDIILEVTKQVGSLKRQANRAINRRELKAQLEGLERSLFVDQLVELEERAAEVNARGQSMIDLEQEGQTQLSLVQAQEEEERGRLLAVDVETETLRRRMDSLREELMERERRRAEEHARLREFRARVEGQRDECERLNHRRDTLRERQTETDRECEMLRDRDAELSAELGMGETGLEEELRELGSRLHGARDQLRAHEHTMRESRDRLIERQSSVRALREQLVAGSPLYRFGERLREQSSDVELFIEHLNVPGELSAAVQSALGERSQFIVSERPFELAELFRAELSATDEAGLAFGVLDRNPPSFTGEGPFGAAGADVGLPSLLERVGVSDAMRPVAEHLLGGVYLASTWDEAMAGKERLPHGGVIVTPDGDMITRTGFSSFRERAGMVSLRVRIDDLEREMRSMEDEYERLVEMRRELEASVNSFEEQHSRTLDSAQVRQAALRELTNQQGTIRGRLFSEQRMAEQLAADLGRLEIEISEARAALGTLESEEESAREAVAALVPEDEEHLRTSIAELRMEVERLEDMRREGREDLSQLTLDVESKRRQLEGVRAQISRDLLESQRLQMEREYVHETITRAYGAEWRDELLTYVAGASRLAAELRSEQEGEVERIKNRIAREGEVDPSSIEQYEQESARLENLLQQKTDLESAVLTLKRTIDRLSETSKQRFLSTFEAVRSKFADFAPRLFGGGKANLELSDPNNPLESGVEIQVRPPGKKPKSMDLLSGGEKALCATALIFAMFMERPSPLCVLDEVDAPLDEANLMRFLAFVKDMSSRTQFIMITHNKQSMIMAERLVGVTMETPGASKVISVSLQDAMSQVA